MEFEEFNMTPKITIYCVTFKIGDPYEKKPEDLFLTYFSLRANAMAFAEKLFKIMDATAAIGNPIEVNKEQGLYAYDNMYISVHRVSTVDCKSTYYVSDLALDTIKAARELSQ